MYAQADLLNIYDKNREDLMRFSVSIVGDFSAAEDVLQEAWMKFSRAAQKQQFDEPVAYLRTIVRTLSLDARRRMQREMKYVVVSDSESLEIEDTVKPGPEQEALARHELAMLQDALKELPDRTRQALLLYWKDELGLREVAHELDISLGQAHAIIKDGVEFCRRRLQRQKH
ncbi:RNA polymerase sigma factor [Sneathiella sp.]|uniref:RNA polymerase sigma factor n=1 Tax=Sneathiella sp. TaxID=1964365 RepID=UPI002637EDBD|nr:RNA polymerase sigma factor [Sneathiella sp.]MDF2368647.1 RNA polymerase sigma factor [Sneathiella sp.]